MWFSFALLSAVFASIRRTNEKQLSQKLNHFTIGWTVQLLSLPVIFIALLWAGKLFNPFDLSLKFWIPTILIWVGFYPLNTFLYVNALKHGELSKILPLSSLGPVFALLLGWTFLGQVPSIGATLGIFIVILGLYILNLKGKYLHNPLSIFTADTANLFTLFSLVLIALAGVIDKIAIQASEPIYYSFISTLGAVPALYVSSLLFRVKEFPKIKHDIVNLSIAGSFFGASYTAYSIALNLGPLAYVSTVRSGSSIIIGAAVGIFYLKESLSRKKLAAIALIIIGSAVIGLYK